MMPRKTTDQFIADARRAHGDTYDYSLVEYVDALTQVTIICQIHGPFRQTPSVHLAKKKGQEKYCGCSRCGDALSSARRTLTQEDFVRKATARHGERYDYSLAVYRASREKVTIICRDHGAFEQTPSNHLQGRGCKGCQVDGFRLTRERYLKQVKGAYAQAYEYPELGRHVLATDRIRMLCPAHGTFDTNSRTHLEGRSGCPDCARFGSRFERKIKRALEQAGIPHETEWTHPTLGDRARLRFDFMLHDMKVLIEFDGAFHYKPIQMPGQTWEDAVHTYAETVRRDQIKTEWAEANGWSLIRISKHNVEDELRRAGVIPVSNTNPPRKAA